MDIINRLIMRYIIIILLLFSGAAYGQSIAPSGAYNTLGVNSGGYQAKRAMIVPKAFQPWTTYDTTGFIWLDTTNHYLYYHNGTSRVQVGAGGGGSGTVTSITAGYGLNGGTITTSGTIRVDTTKIATIRMLDSVANEIPTVNDYVPYTGATDSVRLGEYQIRAGQVALDLTPTAPTVVGGMYWDVTNVCPAMPFDATYTHRFGEAIVERGRNNTGTTISAGKVVYISGAQGNNPTITMANPDSVNSSRVIGITVEAIADNATGFVMVTGKLDGINTSGFTVGAALYLDTTTGGLTQALLPPPHNVVYIGQALNSTNNGRVFIRPAMPLGSDTTLGNASEQIAPTQQAVKKYVNTAISGKQNFSDTTTWDATKANLNTSVATRQLYTDTSTFDATRSWVTSQGYGTGTVKSVGSGFGLSGGAITTTGTLRVDTTNVPTQYRVDTTAANALSRINSKGTVSSVAVANGFGLSISGSPVTTTGTITATVDTSKVATKADVNAKGSGTVTSVGATGGTGISISGSPITSAGTFTVTNTAPDQTVSLTGAGTVSVTGTYPTFTVTGTGGAGGVASITSTGSTIQVTGTTTVNVEVDTTHPFTFTGTNTFTRDITVDSASVGTGNGLSTNIRFGRGAFAAPTTATGVVALGENACRLITTGINNIAIGRNAQANTSVSVNGLVAVGAGNLNYSTGDNNVAIGNNVLARAVAWNGIANVAVGINAGNVMTSGSSNTFVGSGTAAALTSGSVNTFLGVLSGSAMTTGSNNVILGGYTGNAGGLDIRTLSNRLVLSDGAGNIRAYHNNTNWLIGTVTDGSTGILQLNGSLGLNTAGNKINIATGTNASVGTGTLSSGTVTINTTAVTASSIIQVQLTSCSSCGTLYIGTVTAGTSFVVTSTNGSDASTFNYWIIN